MPYKSYYLNRRESPVKLCQEMRNAIAYYKSVIGQEPSVYLLCDEHIACKRCDTKRLMHHDRISRVARDHCIVCLSLERYALNNRDVEVIDTSEVANAADDSAYNNSEQSSPEQTNPTKTTEEVVDGD